MYKVVSFVAFWLMFSAQMLMCFSHALAEEKKEETKSEATEPPAPYERICTVDVFYLWRVKPYIAGEGPPITQEYFSTVSEQGFILDEIQARLNSRLPLIRSQALARCRNEHHDAAACVYFKLASLADDYPKMDHLRRRMLYLAVRDDCSSSLGQCLGTEVTQMKCWMNVPPDTVVPNEPRVEVKQEGNYEPPMEQLGETFGFDAKNPGNIEEVEEQPETVPEPEAVSVTTEGAEVIKPKKKRKKKKTDKPAVGDLMPEPELPFNRPFSLP